MVAHGKVEYTCFTQTEQSDSFRND